MRKFSWLLIAVFVSSASFVIVPSAVANRAANTLTKEQKASIGKTLKSKASESKKCDAKCEQKIHELKMRLQSQIKRHINN